MTAEGSMMADSASSISSFQEIMPQKSRKSPSTSPRPVRPIFTIGQPLEPILSASSTPDSAECRQRKTLDYQRPLTSEGNRNDPENITRSNAPRHIPYQVAGASTTRPLSLGTLERLGAEYHTTLSSSAPTANSLKHVIPLVKPDQFATHAYEQTRGFHFPVGLTAESAERLGTESSSSSLSSSGNHNRSRPLGKSHRRKSSLDMLSLRTPTADVDFSDPAVVVEVEQAMIWLKDFVRSYHGPDDRSDMTLSPSTSNNERDEEDAPLLDRSRSMNENKKPDPIQNMFGRIRYEFTFNKVLRHSTQVAVAITAASLLTFIEAFRSFIHGKGWAAITVVMIVEVTYGGFLKKAIQRAIGTIVGGLLGLTLLASVFFLPPACFQCSYKPFFLTVGIFWLSFGITWLKMKNPKSPYVYLIMLLTVLIVVLGEYSEATHDDDWDHDHLPFYMAPFYVSTLKRIGLVIVGIIISFVVVTFVFPERASTRLPESFGNILSQVTQLLQFVNTSYTNNAAQNDLVGFRDTAIEKADKISSSLEKLRGELNFASEEIFLSQSEKRVVKSSPLCLSGTERLFYLAVTMIYGRCWIQDTRLFQSMDVELHLMSESMYTILSMLSDILIRHHRQDKLSHARKNSSWHSLPTQERDASHLPMLREASRVTLVLFRYQQARLHESKTEFSDLEWGPWNHFALSFMQCLVNLDMIIESCISMGL